MSKVFFVLDEAASLGNLECLEDLVDKYRGYGCRAIFAYQSVGQLKKCWPKDQGQTLLSNTAKVFFGVSDYETANLVSNMLGKQTIIEESGGSGSTGGGNRGWGQSKGEPSSNGGWNWGWSRNKTWRPVARELERPEELMTLSPRVCISLPGGGVRPVKTYLVRHYEWQKQGWLNRAWVASRTLFHSFALLTAGVVLAAMLFEKASQSRVYQVPVYQERQVNRDGKGNRPAAVRAATARTVNGRNGGAR